MDSSIDDFTRRTDRKSIYQQIKNLVGKAQEVAHEDLIKRRERVKRLLEYEDKIYEEEFARKVKSRIDEDIKARKDALVKIKEENMRNETKFLEQKRIQQQMESCYEIRNALRRKERFIVKECQLEQIVEKERAQRREIELDKYWLEVDKKNMEVIDARQEQEDCLKRKLIKQTKFVLDKQMEEQAEKQAEMRKEKQAEAEELAKLLEEIRLEEFDRTMLGLPLKALQYRKELLDMIAANEQRKRSEVCEEAKEHLKMMIEIRELERKEAIAAHERKRAFHKATIEYIEYVKRMRELQKQAETMRENRIDDLRHVDICTKSNLREVAKRKAEHAAVCYAELRRQICEQYERKLREEAERRENKILENRFAKVEKSRTEILQERQKNRQELDKQVQELEQIRALEEDKFNKSITKAIDDPEYCTQLAEQYINEGVDYLEPHANWIIVACPQKQYVEKPPGDGLDTVKPGCWQPCGCGARANIECRLRNETKRYDC